MTTKLKKPLQALLIAPDEKMRENILSGKKKITIREGWRDYQKGSCMVCCPIEPWCIGVEINDIEHSSIAEVTPEQYKADGYNSRNEMISDLKRFYSDIGLESKVTIIQWNNASGKLVEEYKK